MLRENNPSRFCSRSSSKMCRNTLWSVRNSRRKLCMNWSMWYLTSTRSIEMKKWWKWEGLWEWFSRNRRELWQLLRSMYSVFVRKFTIMQQIQQEYLYFFRIFVSLENMATMTMLAVSILKWMIDYQLEISLFHLFSGWGFEKIKKHWKLTNRA